MNTDATDVVRAFIAAINSRSPSEISEPPRVRATREYTGDIQMASDLEYVGFVVDQIEPSGNITYRKMFGEYAPYSNGKVVALICDNRLFVKQIRYQTVLRIRGKTVSLRAPVISS